jgi:SAM-dependent methyltransferase
VLVSGSYTSVPVNLKSQFRQFIYLWSFQRKGAALDVAHMIREAREISADVKDKFGIDLIDKEILEIGPGPFLVQARYFAAKNKVVGIDSDVISDRFSIRKSAQMLRANGAFRTFKTMARKAAGIDRIYRSEICRELGIARVPQVQVEHGDATALPFNDAQFDFVHCRSVVHSVPEPERAVREMARVVRPGGVVHLDLHLYASYNGALDPRTMTGTDSTYYWAHLRSPDGAKDMALLNRLRLQEWNALFHELLPGCLVRATRSDERIRAIGEEFQTRGELKEYSIEELTSHALDVLWRKPGGSPEALISRGSS